MSSNKNKKNIVSVVELSFANGNHYQGEWCEGKPHGFGTYKWKDGSEYCGQFVNGEFHGRGSKTWTTGKRFSGDWKHSLYHGHGEIIFPDKSNYVGSFEEGLYHGLGKRQWSNKDVYDGEWKKGKREGPGVLTRDKDTHFIYSGNWLNGKMHGNGRAEWDGSSGGSSGSSSNGGSSSQSDSNENSNSNSNNNNSCRPNTPRTCYEGQWNNGLRHGRGTLTTLDGTKEQGIIGVVVKGTFVRGRIHGNAELTYPEGDKYIGDVESGQPNGEGTMYWVDGSSFKGEFVSGTPCGRGVYRDSKGELSGCFGTAGVSGPGSKTWKISKHDIMDICSGAQSTQGTQSGPTFNNSNNNNAEEHKNRRDGNGEEKSLVEMKYVGQLMDDQMHGPGTLCWPDGRVYSGHFVQDQIEGQGTMRWKEKSSTSAANGGASGFFDCSENTYVGSFRSGRFEGQGELTFADGATYKGLFQDGLFHGKGDFMGCRSNNLNTMQIVEQPTAHSKTTTTTETSETPETTTTETTTTTTTRMRITGKWRHGKPDGVVEIDFDAVHGGGTYRGEVTRGMFSGKGTRVWSNGNIFIGQWETCGSSGSSGQSRRSRRSRSGGGSKSNTSSGSSSSGVHKGLLMHADDRGTMHGRGSYLYASGCQYVGEFEHGVRSGSGKQIWPSGHLYVGEWKHDAPHGCGMFVDGTSGTSLAGQWNHGRLVQEIVEQVVPSSAASAASATTSNSSVPSSHHVVVGVAPFQSHQVHVGGGSEDLSSNLKMQRKQIQIRLDGSVYVGTTWRGVNHGDGVHVSFDGKQRQGPWTMGCSSDVKFIQHPHQRSVERANQSLSLKKDDLRSKAKRITF